MRRLREFAVVRDPLSRDQEVRGATPILDFHDSLDLAPGVPVSMIQHNDLQLGSEGFVRPSQTRENLLCALKIAKAAFPTPVRFGRSLGAAKDLFSCDDLLERVAREVNLGAA